MGIVSDMIESRRKMMEDLADAPVGSVWQYMGGFDPIYRRREDGEYQCIGMGEVGVGVGSGGVLRSPTTPVGHPDFRRRRDLEKPTDAYRRAATVVTSDSGRAAELRQMMGRSKRDPISVAGRGVFAHAMRVVVNDFIRRNALPEWLPGECDIDIVRNGAYTVATCVGTDGVRRAGCSRKHPRDAEDPFVGARYAIGRLLGQG